MTAQAAVLEADPSELPVVSVDFSLAARLPPSLWKSALQLFSFRPESPLSVASSHTSSHAAAVAAVDEQPGSGVGSTAILI